MLKMASHGVSESTAGLTSLSPGSVKLTFCAYI